MANLSRADIETAIRLVGQKKLPQDKVDSYLNNLVTPPGLPHIDGAKYWNTFFKYELYQRIVPDVRFGKVMEIFSLYPEAAKVVAYAKVCKDKLLSKPAVKGWTVFESGTLNKFQHSRAVYSIYEALLRTVDNARVFASPIQTPGGKDIWMNRINYDHSNVVLLYSLEAKAKERFDNPEGDYQVINQHNIKQLQAVIWDGNTDTRLLLVKRKDPMLRRFNLMDQLK